MSSHASTDIEPRAAATQDCATTWSRRSAHRRRTSDVLLQRDFEQLTVAEIARIHRARLQVRDYLSAVIRHDAITRSAAMLPAAPPFSRHGAGDRPQAMRLRTTATEKNP
jgi:hypothetical protein